MIFMICNLVHSAYMKKVCVVYVCYEQTRNWNWNLVYTIWLMQSIYYMYDKNRRDIPCRWGQSQFQANTASGTWKQAEAAKSISTHVNNWRIPANSIAGRYCITYKKKKQKLERVSATMLISKVCSNYLYC